MTIRPRPQPRAILYRRDLTQGAIESGIWEALTGGNQKVTEVSVLTVEMETDDEEVPHE